MIYREFKGKRMPLLGFGAMRLPTKKEGEETVIDYDLAEKMIDLAMSRGVNYFDTAYPYHGGKSEIVLGEILSKYPRESYYLADKYPGHQLRSEYNPAEVFEDQLKKCGVDYFDFYLLHDVNEKSVETYTDQRFGIIDYFLEQKKKGRIKHLGFSSHAMLPCLQKFLEEYGEHMEFCQIQLNYLDWTLQKAREKCALLNAYNIPIWVMEPVRGGKLANLEEAQREKLASLSSGRSAASFAFRFLMDIPGVTVILSGMSNMYQVEDNLATFEREEPLSIYEKSVLEEITYSLVDTVPCTGCKYCVDGCPMGLDIPMMLSTYNEIRFTPAMSVARRIEFLPEDKKPSACISCGACSFICPQKIDIPKALSSLSELVDKVPKWADICRQREEEERRLKGEK